MPKRLSQKQKGQSSEKQALKLLKGKGYRILARNYTSPYGEIDLIALDKEFLVFIEVKGRYSPRWGSAEEAINLRKCLKIIRTGEYFRQHYSCSLPEATRIDVIGFDWHQQSVTHQENVYRPGLC